MKKMLLLLLILLFAAGEGLCADPDAARYNEKGVAAMEAKDFDSAIEEFKEALRFEPGNAVITENLANAYNTKGVKLAEANKFDEAIYYFKLASEALPEEKLYSENISLGLAAKGHLLYKEKKWNVAAGLLKEALVHNPKNYQALLILGEISYYTQDLVRARDYWQKASLAEPDEKTAQILKDKLAKLEKELAIEGAFEKYSLPLYFDIRFEREVDRYEPYDIYELLRAARQSIGQDFQYFPEYKIIVILYPEEEFTALHRTPPWVAGLYDGKIRLPIKKKLYKENDLKKILWHEYTHAIVYDLGGANVPIWLNEGLAKYEELKDESKVELPRLKTAQKNNLLIPLSAFQQKEFTLDAGLLYEQSYSMVNYLIRNWRLWKVNLILKHLKEGDPPAEAFKKELHLTLEEFDEKWREYLKKEYGEWSPSP